MKQKFNFYDLDKEMKKGLLEGHFGRGHCTLHTSGMSGEIFIFDQGKSTFPRYSCVKIPKPLKSASNDEIARRFVRELELQKSFFYNKYVHWAFDYDHVFNIPIASFRYWGNDLRKLITTTNPSEINKLSLLIYICIGLEHCYKRGLVAHQDLKPANIFIQNLRNDFRELPEHDIFDFPKIADFGLANAFIDYSVFNGARPYMAPEQWNEESLSPATDIFALGIIFFELATNGFHPTGIYLNDFWPSPKEGNTKKWTRPAPWKNWIDKGCNITVLNDTIIDKEILGIIQRMLKVTPNDRPTISEIKSFLLNRLKEVSEESHSHVKYLIDYHLNKSSEEGDWPYIDKKWENFKKAFG